MPQTEIINLMKPNPDGIWTASEYTEAGYGKMPKIILTSYQQTMSLILQGLNFWSQRATIAAARFLRVVDVQREANPYYAMYLARGPLKIYTLPYFSDYHHEIQQNWQENQGPLGAWEAKFRSVIESVQKVKTPSAGIVRPKSWAGSNDSSYTIEFPLLNTVHSEDYSKNQNVIKSLIKDNLHSQQGTAGQLPPVIYTVSIPGVRFSPAAVVTRLWITNQGTMNQIGNDIIPDAWNVQITIRELINESEEIYNAAVTGDPSGVGAIFTEDPFTFRVTE